MELKHADITAWTLMIAAATMENTIYLVYTIGGMGPVAMVAGTLLCLGMIFLALMIGLRIIEVKT